jgi:LPS-assembly protein
MYKIIFLISILVSSIVAKDFELLADNVSTEGDKTIAKGNVVVQGANYYIQADKAIYDKENSVLELFGNVNTVKDADVYSVSNYAKIDMKNDCSTVSPLFMLNNESGIWFNAKKAQSEKDIYKVYNSTVSSCNTQKPTWSISFKEGEYDREKEWLSIYHPTFYLGNIPIGYLPYFGFPTSDKRQSGLLIPQFSISNDEGLGLIQPIYFAPENEWDLEVNPQMRGKRGSGLYSTLRFVGDKSKGIFKAGYFQNKSSWIDKYNLENSKVVGYEFEYEKENPLSVIKGHEDGVYVDYKYYNDVDYLNLKDFSTTSTDAVADSRVNYFYQTQDLYFGTYLIHQLDTTKGSNDDTIQTLPSVQAHKYNDNLFLNNLLYSVDYKVKNYTRKTGLNGTEQQIFIPISYYTPLFDDFLTLEVSENIFASDINYHNFDTRSYENATFIRNYHKLALSTNLIKSFDDFVHNFNFDVSYTIPSYKKEKGDIYKITNDSEELNFISYDIQKENLALDFSQYFYNNNGGTILKHIAQQIVYYEGYDYKYSDLSNDIVYYMSDFMTLSNQSKFSHEYSKISYSSTTMTLEEEKDYKVSLSHTMEDSISKDSNYIMVELEKSLDYKYDVFSKVEYDYEKSLYNKFEIGMSMTKSCWGYKVKYIRDITPINSTNNSSDSVTENKIFFEISFIPMGGFMTNLHKN